MLWVIVVVLLAGAGAMVGVVYMTLGLASGFISLFIGSHIEDGEVIDDTRLVPVDWVRKKERAQIRPKLKKHLAVRRLAKVIRYYKHTPLVESEAARMGMIKRLKRIRSEWKKKTWQEIYPWK